MADDRVSLHGMWASPYAKRVELALRVKGIEYEYIEEDLMNKSPALLQYNPVHKKVPVLVHNGKAIAESTVILEYINETWKDGPGLLPLDPYERANVRFWASFLQQLLDTMILAMKSKGEAQEKAVVQVHEKLRLLEEGLNGNFPGGFPSTVVENGDMGLLDIVLFSVFGTHKAQEQAFGIKALNSDKYPLVCSWVNVLNEQPMVKELLPPHAKLVGFLEFIKQRALSV